MATKKSRKKSVKKTTRLNRFWQKITTKVDGFLARRPHRSFRRTRRRDYVRSLKLPGYWSFTFETLSLIWSNRWLFIRLVLLFSVVTTLLVGIGSQETYSQLKQVLDSTSEGIFDGAWDQVGKAALLAVSSVGISPSGDSSDSGSAIFASIIMIFVWLIVVWLLRSIMAGGKPKLRDGLYNAGAPFLGVVVLSLVLVVQLLPIGIGAIGFMAATNYGLYDGGVVAMVFWLLMALLTCLSAYWLTGTMFALLVATIPGMYPWQAIKTAGDLVIGRRLRILYRFIWMLVLMLIGWALIFIPVIMLDSWLKSWATAIDWMPIVPLVASILTVVGAVWVATYTYLLYRKVVDDDAEPA